jgi:hypothetical protein
MSRIHLFRNYYLGTGLITVVGTSFATLSTANAVSFFVFSRNSGLTSSTDLRLDVCGRFVSFYDCRRWDCHPWCLP